MPITGLRRHIEIRRTQAHVDPGGATRFTLRTGDGQEWNLSDYESAAVMVGRRGFDSPQYQPYTWESPGFDGEEFAGARALGRDIILPVFLRAEDREDFLGLKRRLLSGLAPRNGLTRLTVSERDGSFRFIDCYYTGRGGEGDQSRDAQGRTWVKLMLELRCPEPFWRGPGFSFQFGGASSGAYFPILPLRMGAATPLGQNTITVPGDVDAFPVWTVHGPTTGGIRLCLVPVGSGERDLFLSSVLAVGEWVQVDTNPNRLTIVDHVGRNRWGDLQAGSSLWPLPPGQIRVEVSASGVTPDTRVTVEAQPRFETA